MKNYILFDLDGTLTDPALGITNSVMYALEKYGVKVGDRTQLYKFIGPPLWESFEKFYGFSKEKANEAVGFYRQYYKDKGIFENAVYAGIPELLAQLKSSGKTLIVATSKPTIFAKQILEHFDLAKYFTFVAGSELDGTRVKKDEVISYALAQNNITDLDSAIMIGDREHDILGAKKVGISAVGVLYGYGDKAELKTAGADYIAEDVESLKEILKG